MFDYFKLSSNFQSLNIRLDGHKNQLKKSINSFLLFKLDLQKNLQHLRKLFNFRIVLSL